MAVSKYSDPPTQRARDLIREKQRHRMQMSADLLAKIAALGMTQSGLARRMKELGDDRNEKRILRSVQDMACGRAPFSGAMRALLGLMEEVRQPERHGAQDGVVRLTDPGG
jgi:hypothetical protein